MRVIASARALLSVVAVSCLLQLGFGLYFSINLGVLMVVLTAQLTCIVAICWLAVRNNRATAAFHKKVDSATREFDTRCKETTASLQELDSLMALQVEALRSLHQNRESFEPHPLSLRAADDLEVLLGRVQELDDTISRHISTCQDSSYKTGSE